MQSLHLALYQESFNECTYCTPNDSNQDRFEHKSYGAWYVRPEVGTTVKMSK